MQCNTTKTEIRTGGLIVLEGIDGSGKTHTTQWLVEKLNRLGYRAISTRQPGGTPAAESLRSWCFDFKTHNFLGETLLDKSEYLVMMAARHQLVENVIKPEIAKGTIVITDRHDWSSEAFQGYNEEWLRQFASMEPDLLIYMRRDITKAIETIRERGDDITKFETEERLTNAFEAYERCSKTNEPVFTIDASDFESESFITRRNEALELIINIIKEKQK